GRSGLEAVCASFHRLRGGEEGPLAVHVVQGLLDELLHGPRLPRALDKYVTTGPWAIGRGVGVRRGPNQEIGRSPWPAHESRHLGERRCWAGPRTRVRGPLPRCDDRLAESEGRGPGEVA